MDAEMEGGGVDATSRESENERREVHSPLIDAYSRE